MPIVLIEDGRFAKISESLPDEGEVIDAAGKWILPGLINVRLKRSSICVDPRVDT